MPDPDRHVCRWCHTFRHPVASIVAEHERDECVARPVRGAA